MSRHGYSEDSDDTWASIRWQGAVKSAIRGKRGQALLRDLLAALDAMPEKALIAEELVTPTGEVCALGCLARARGVDVSGVAPDDPENVAKLFGVSESLIREITYHNDEHVQWWGRRGDDPAERWRCVRSWVASQLREKP
jgi:hypothetical protein